VVSLKSEQMPVISVEREFSAFQPPLTVDQRSPVSTRSQVPGRQQRCVVVSFQGRDEPESGAYELFLVLVEEISLERTYTYNGGHSVALGKKVFWLVVDLLE
jgi:hypothetical protein